MKSKKMWVAVEIEVTEGPEFDKFLKEHMDVYTSWSSDGNSIHRTGRICKINKPKNKIEWETSNGRSMRGNW